MHKKTIQLVMQHPCAEICMSWPQRKKLCIHTEQFRPLFRQGSRKNLPQGFRKNSS